MTKLRAVAHLGMSGDGWTESKKRIWTRFVRAKEAAGKVRTEKESNTSGAKGRRILNLLRHARKYELQSTPVAFPRNPGLQR